MVNTDMLLGTGNYTRAEGQAGFEPLVQEQCQQTGMAALVQTLQLATPQESFVTVVQGVDEPFLSFAGRLTAVVEKQTFETSRPHCPKSPKIASLKGIEIPNVQPDRTGDTLFLSWVVAVAQAHGEEPGSQFSITSSVALPGWHEEPLSLPCSGLDKPSSLSLCSQPKGSSPTWGPSLTLLQLPDIFPALGNPSQATVTWIMHILGVLVTQPSPLSLCPALRFDLQKIHTSPSTTEGPAML
ncbi:hypothetical protein DUI87_19320 [Hirundo rustica rustica]|uniref:Uncharacterized protein n=1 Tax=Hirundo rustica rustica TaxID=333673 RepID=A0A3M0JSG0_HIRRU|nr:hypothetical protein DUI87_19320 [Hirundo rustica rustica]